MSAPLGHTRITKKPNVIVVGVTGHPVAMKGE